MKALDRTEAFCSLFTSLAALNVIKQSRARRNSQLLPHWEEPVVVWGAVVLKHDP